MFHFLTARPHSGEFSGKEARTIAFSFVHADIPARERKQLLIKDETLEEKTTGVAEMRRKRKKTWPHYDEVCPRWKPELALLLRRRIHYAHDVISGPTRRDTAICEKVGERDKENKVRQTRSDKKKTK